MAQLTTHFSLEEFTTNGKHPEIDNTPPTEYAGNILNSAQKVEHAREILGGWPIRITYAYRCIALNRACGSQSDHSAHVYGLGVDLVPLGMSLLEAWDKLIAHPTWMEDVDQLILERGCIHMGLPTIRQKFTPRHELRSDEDANGRRTYPLIGIWKAPDAR